MARESILLQRTLERAGLPAMILKGAPLAILAYGELGLKESWDIDLLTAEEFAPEAAALLVELGYDNSLSHLDLSQLEAYVRLTKDAPFTHPVSGITVELHWSVTDHRRLLRGIGVNGPAQDVATPAGTLRTIADDELFAYLCFHGAIHSWCPLRWLADFGALIARRSEADLERLWNKSHDYGARRAASVALLLCHRLLGKSLSPEFLRSLRKDPMVRRLERNVLAILSYRVGHRRACPLFDSVVSRPGRTIRPVARTGPRDGPGTRDVVFSDRQVYKCRCLRDWSSSIPRFAFRFGSSGRART
jgi:hypothetical protein